MNQATVIQRLFRDLKASAAKTAVLGVLLLVGLCFWVPPLLRAFSSETAATRTTPTDPFGTTATNPASAPSPADAKKKPRDSAAITKLLQEHPLLQPASVAELPESPFDLNNDQLPLPVLIAEDELDDSLPLPAPPKAKLPQKLEGLTLKSTLVGPHRRAALINNRLYQQGELVPWGDRHLRLQSVQRKVATLSDGSQLWQLTLKDSRSEPDE